MGRGLHHEEHRDHEQEPGGGAHPGELGPGEQRAQGVASEDTTSVQQGGHTAQATSLLSRHSLRNVDTEEGIHRVVTDMSSPHLTEGTAMPTAQPDMTLNTRSIT